MAGDISAVNLSLVTLYQKGATLEEMAEQTGLSEPEVLEKLDALSNSRDFLGRARQRRLVLVKLEQNFYDAAERAQNASDKNASGLHNASRNAFEALAKEWRKLDEEERADKDEIDNSYKRAFLEIVREGIQRTIGEFQARYPDLEPEAIEQAIRRNVTDVAREKDQD